MSSRKRLPGKSAGEDCKILVNSSVTNAYFRIRGLNRLEYNLNLPENRYGAIEEIRTLLGFTKTEWRVLLHAISKTDNGWLQFAFGSVTVDFKKFVDADQLHLRIDVGENPKSKQSVKYIYDLTDFIRPKL
jgi:hypothetical protein